MTGKLTPYADINQLLDYFNKKIHTILGKNCIGMYVYGSLALGDFDPEISDIDFIVITKHAVAENSFLLLEELHKQFYLSESKWAKKIEAAYIAQNAFDLSKTNTNSYPQIEKGRDLTRDKLEMGWSFQCHILREFGLVVSGPDPKSLFSEVNVRHMLNAAKHISELWYQQAHDENECAFLKEEDKFVISTLCRFLYLLHSQKVATKKLSVQWARENLDQKWINIMDDILMDRDKNTENKFQNTIEFIQYTNDSFSGVELSHRQI